VRSGTLVGSLLFLAVLLVACPAEPQDEREAAPAPVEVTPTPDPEVIEEPSPRPYEPLPDDLTLDLELVAEGLGQVVDLVAAPGSSRVFAVEKEGTVRIIEDGEVVDDPFLDLRDSVRASDTRGEQGMLSLAFHPAYERNGRFFVYYVTEGDDDTRLDEFRVSEDRMRADGDSQRTVLDVPQPFRWHNGGKIIFDRGGMLMLSLGDGGVSGDPELEAQDPTNLLGAIVRIDVDEGDPYGIPPDNPFADSEDGAPEVWAYGLRNPWRIHLDDVEGMLYIADVGQYIYEWVNVVADDDGGHNFGWPITEGSSCFSGHEELCPGEDLTDPVFEYHRADPSCAIIGGVVYDGPGLPEVAGHYFYSDFCGGWLRSFRHVEGEVRDEREWFDDHTFSLPVTIGTDPEGEILLSDSEGRIWRVVRG
jgi:glucose/arabinose dehydrogenase